MSRTLSKLMCSCQSVPTARDPHPSPRAHRLIGEALAEGLSPWLAEPERLEALVERQREALAAGGDQR